MRVLVAGRNAKALAKAAGAFANDLTMATATTKAAAFALLDHTEFDLVVACETLGDGSGLEVLSQVAVNTPNTLRIFAARPATLTLLKGELGFFGLFRTLPYPINFRVLWAAMELARAATDPQGPRRSPRQTPPVRHVVLEPDWEATQPLPVLDVNQITTAPSGAARTNAVPARTARPNTAPTDATRPNKVLTDAARTNMVRTNGAQASSGRAGTTPVAAARANTPRANAAPTATPRAAATWTNRLASQGEGRIPESETFRRALARRKDAKQRQEPSVTNESFAQLAQLSLKRKPTHEGRAIPGGRKRTALFVGSGVFAAGAAAVLTFFMLGSNSSIGQPALPIAASIDRPVPQNVLPWQQPESELAEDSNTTTFLVNQTVTPAVAADMEVQGEADSEQLSVEPDHPGPPPPNPPPGPSEPPQYDASGMPVQE